MHSLALDVCLLSIWSVVLYDKELHFEFMKFLKPDNFITGQLLNVFKCVWINLGMWIYFFKCIFCEIQREIKYSWWKLSIWIKTCCKWTHSGFWRLGVKRNAKRPINLSVHCWNTELFWTFWVKCSWLWAVWVWTGRVCMCVDCSLTLQHHALHSRLSVRAGTARAEGRLGNSSV